MFAGWGSVMDGGGNCVVDYKDENAEHVEVLEYLEIRWMDM